MKMFGSAVRGKDSCSTCSNIETIRFIFAGFLMVICPKCLMVSYEDIAQGKESDKAKENTKTTS